MITNIKKYRQSIINRSFWFASGLAIIFAVAHHKDYSVGILAGVLISALNFLFLSIQLSKMAGNVRISPLHISFLIRYGVLALCLFGLMQLPQMNIFGFLIGYFILQLNIFIAAFLEKTKKQAVSDEPLPATVP